MVDLPMLGGSPLLGRSFPMLLLHYKVKPLSKWIFNYSTQVQSSQNVKKTICRLIVVERTVETRLALQFPTPQLRSLVIIGVETGEGHHPYIQPPQHRPMCPTKHIRQIQERSWEILNCCFMPQIRFIDWCTSDQKHEAHDFVKSLERWDLTNFKCHNWL